MARGLPTSADLVEAVAEFLRTDLLPLLDGRAHFDARVAANVLDTVERELRDGGAYAGDHVRRLAALGVADDARLAGAIREGALDGRLAELVAILRRDTRDRLAIANPRYLTEADADGPPPDPSGTGR
jgi:hypothetical protein